MQPTRWDIAVELNGKSYPATYYVEKDWLYVNSNWGSKNAKPGPSPGSIARLLLHEILRDAEREKRL